MVSYIRVNLSDNSGYVEWTRSFCPSWRETYHFSNGHPSFFADIVPTTTLDGILNRLREKGHVITYGRREAE